MFRLHIDVPLGTDLEEAKDQADAILAALVVFRNKHQIQFRLSADGDRGNKNHMNIVDGRPGGSKSRL